MGLRLNYDLSTSAAAPARDLFSDYSATAGAGGFRRSENDEGGRGNAEAGWSIKQKHPPPDTPQDVKKMAEMQAQAKEEMAQIEAKEISSPLPKPEIENE